MTHRQEPVGDDVAKRLARVTGHAASLTRMWDDGRECEEMLTQISAVRAALGQISKVIIEHHIEHCIREAVSNGDTDEVIKDLKKSLARLF